MRGDAVLELFGGPQEQELMDPEREPMLLRRNFLRQLRTRHVSAKDPEVRRMIVQRRFSRPDAATSWFETGVLLEQR